MATLEKIATLHTQFTEQIEVAGRKNVPCGPEVTREP